jgi:hypothetical protein
MTDVLERFRVRADDGTVYDALILQERIRSRSIDESRDTYIPGMKEARLVGGGSMNVLDEDTYEIVRTGERVRRIR